MCPISHPTGLTHCESSHQHFELLLHRTMGTLATEQKAIEKRYREYCDACQSGHLERLTEFWTLPASFSVDFGGPETVHKMVQTSSELISLYSTEFGPSTGVDKTTIDTSEVRFFGEKLATIETTLRHTVKGQLHDRQHASYGCRNVDGKWVFITHISKVESSGA
jgi:hypothetical protein